MGEKETEEGVLGEAGSESEGKRGLHRMGIGWERGTSGVV
jgi:hypothetical protein